MDVGQAKVPACVTIRQSFVIQAQQMQNRRVHVVHVNFILDNVIAKIIALSVDGAALNAAASEPHREGVRVMIPTIATLSCRRSAKLAAPPDERILQQTTTSKVF